MGTGFPGWLARKPTGTGTADMLDHLPPGSPRHVELIDGELITRSPQTAFHMFTVMLFEQALLSSDSLMVIREMTVTLGIRQRLEPDIMVVASSALTSLRTTSFKPEDVHLVVEVVSPESLERDRSTKPIKYSDAGIRYLWRVEQEDDRPVVYTFELEPSVKAYVPTGIHRGRLKTDIGFKVDIDLDLGKFIGP